MEPEVDDLNDDERPLGIFEWSLDYHVFTLPFVSQGGTYARYRVQLDIVRDLLGLGMAVVIFVFSLMLSSRSAFTYFQVNVNSDSLLTAEHSGLDPLHSESAEALAILVHEMGLLRHGRNSCWERSWHEIARCLLSELSHQRAAEQGPHVMFRYVIGSLDLA